MKMKQVNEFKALSPKERAKNIVSFARKSMDSKKLLAKVLIAGEEIGDFGRGNGEMNTYAKTVTAYPESIDKETGVVTPAYDGIDLRRDVQGTYEAANVLRGIREGKITVSEAEFDSDVFGSFPLIMLSGFLGKSPEKVGEALEIIRSRKDVTKRLQALRKGTEEVKETPAAKEKPESDKEIVSEIQTPAGSTYFVPIDLPILNHEELMNDLVSELKGAGTIQDCENYLNMIGQLRAIVESRMEVLEAEAAKPRELAAA